MAIFDFFKKRDIKKFEGNISIANRVSQWLDNILTQHISNDIVAFCFNLYDDGDDKWSMELVGTDRFDIDDADWPCNELTDFSTRKKPLVWHKETDWEKVLAEMVTVLRNYLESGKYAEVLKSKVGVGIGFVDGDVKILYSNNTSIKMYKQKTWQHEITGSDNAILFGVNIFDYEWENTGEKVEVRDPIYGQKYKFPIYRVIIKNQEYKFASGEFSNSVFGFYVQKY